MQPPRPTHLSLALLAAAVAWSTPAMATQHEPCIPDCVAEGKICGYDGCTGSCGTCLAPTQCNVDGTQCELSCTPWCDGKTCGPDGCGDQIGCGTCLPGQVCWEGHCSGNCVPQCASKVCGPDGCELGFVCGFCGDDEMCNDTGTACVPCVGNCWMVTDEGQVPKQCGDDGCGEACGFCYEDYVCDEPNFMCVECGGPGFPCDDPVVDPNQPCEPACVGALCGPDGCGGSCGVCDFGQSCLHGLCVDCTPNCQGVECGGDGCGGSCGVCAAGLSCIDGLCGDASGLCVPNCAGRSCGSDGCDGTCGQCPTGQACDVDGHCTGAGWSEPEGGAFNPCAADEIWDDLAGGCVLDTSGAGGLVPPGQDDGGCASHAGGTGLLASLLAALALGIRRRRRSHPVLRRGRA